MKHNTKTVLEYSYAAARVNGVYCTTTDIAKGVYSNRDLIKYSLKKDHYVPDETFEPLTVLEEDRANLEKASIFMRRYTLLSLGNISKFETDVYTAYSIEETDEKNIGIIAYFPYFVNRKIEEKTYVKLLKEEYKNSEFVRDKILEIDLKIIKAVYLVAYAKTIYIAGNNGNLFSFFSGEDYPVGSLVKVKARNNGEDRERSSGYKMNKLNYVKFIRE